MKLSPEEIDTYKQKIIYLNKKGYELLDYLNASNEIIKLNGSVGHKGYIKESWDELESAYVKFKKNFKNDGKSFSINSQDDVLKIYLLEAKVKKVDEFVEKMKEATNLTIEQIKDILSQEDQPKNRGEKAREYGFNPSGTEKQKAYALDIIFDHLLTDDFIKRINSMENDAVFREYFAHLLRMSSKWWIDKAQLMDMELYRIDWCNERAGKN